jgi:hypothetical protein
MADYKATTSEFQSVANAIRTKGGTQAQLEWPTGFVSAVQAIPTGGGVIEPLSVTQNGIYNPPSGVDGYSPVTVNVSGGGDIPLLSESQWIALTTQQKKSYGLVAIQDAITGYIRGKLVNGSDYTAILVQSGTGSASISDTFNVSGTYKLFVLALNGEASTYQLNIDVKINGTSITGETISFNSWTPSSENTRNYRLNEYSVSVSKNDTISIEITNRNNYSSFVWALVECGELELDKAVSYYDKAASGTNTNSGFVLQGTFNSSVGGTIELDAYVAGATVVTQNPGKNYKSSYIFWFTE